MKKLANTKLKELNNLAIPLIAQSISGLLIGLADECMVGRISISAYSSVGIIGSLLSFLAGLLGFTSVSFNILGSKAKGKKDNNNLKDEFVSSLLLNLLIGIFFFIIIFVLKKQLLILIYGFQGETLYEGIKYLNSMSFYILIQLCIFTFSALLKIEKKTKWIFICSTGTAVLDVILNYIFIFGNLGMPKLGVQGAGLSTVFSISINLLIYMYICRNYFSFTYEKIKLYKKKIMIHIKESLPLMGQEALEGSIFIIAINAIVSRIGVNELSSYLIIVQLVNIALMPMYMYGSSALTLISENYGAKDEEALCVIPKLGVIMSLIIYSFISIFFIIFRTEVPKLITENKEIIFLSSNLLIFFIMANLVHPVCTIYRYSLQAIGESKFVLLNNAKINVVSLIIMLIFIYGINLGVYGVFIALFINYTGLFYIYSKKWNKVLSKKVQVSL
ncbi:MATE family efflux transporter [Clostridium hydrogeniformans]|uniref:MATE family efflux transporter n=1 Tax=Clostridium hydrogeniformans TaxID=349933 RepID=UPI0004820955|nr:MATE family efflux transporter [Clostridium hydrogeniformans]